MNVTIIIVNWNGGDLLLRCLESIRASKTSFAVHVIVVDNDSSDGSREAAAAKFPEFDIFNSGANLGFGRANNLARSRVSTPLILFLNPDTELKEDTLETAVKSLLARPDVGALGCKMRYPNGQVQQQGLQWESSPWTVFLEMLFVTKNTARNFKRWLPLFDPNCSTYIRKLYGGFVLARREVLDQAGWFDDRYFMYAEDVDLSRTIRALGWKLYYCSESEIMHVSGGTSAKAPSGFSILMKNESLNKLMQKYYGDFGAWLHRLGVFIGAAVRSLVLVPLCILSSASRSANFAGSVFKQKTNLLWSLGLAKAQPSGLLSPAPPHSPACAAQLP